MLLPLEIYNAAGKVLLDNIQEADYAVLPLMVPKAEGSHVDTHLGVVHLDNTFQVAFALSREDIGRSVDELVQNYFVPGTHAMSLFAQRLAKARFNQCMGVRTQVTAGMIAGRHRRGELNEITVSANELTPLVAGDSIKVRNHRYGVLQSRTLDNGHQKLLLDRALQTDVNTGIVVKKLALVADPGTRMGTLVTAPTTIPGYQHTDRGIALSFYEEERPYGLTHIHVALNGGVILD